jgi:hypothetical protein
MISLNSAAGKIDPSLIEAISKGQLTLKEAELMLSQKALPPSASSLQLLALQHQSTLSKSFTPACSLCGNVCSFVWYTKKKSVPPPDTSLVSVLREIGKSVVACGECTELDMDAYEACTLKSLLSSGSDKQEAAE